MYDATEIKIARMNREAETLLATTASALPSDPLLTSDAAFLRQFGITSMEFMQQVMLGLREATPNQMAAAKTLIAYQHRPQMSKVQTEVVGDENIRQLARALDFASMDELLVTEARIMAAKAIADAASTEKA